MRKLLTQSALLGVALFSVQGTIYLYQLIAASLLSPIQYSSIRIVESAGALGSLLVTFGLPSIALARFGLITSGRQREEYLKANIILLLLFFMIFCFAFFAASKAGYLGSEVTSVDAYVTVLTFAISLRLFLSAVQQAQQRLGYLAISSIAACSASYLISFACYFVGFDPLLSWLLGRIALEIIISIALVIPLLTFSREAQQTSLSDNNPPAATAFSLAKTAWPVGASLAFRSILENGPILFLSTLGVNATLIAQVGLAITIIGIASFPATIVQSALIPRIASHIDRKETFTYVGSALFGGAVASLATLMVVAQITSQQPQWMSFLSWTTVFIAALILVSKIVAGACGGLLLLLNQGRRIMILNGATLAWGVVVAVALRELSALADPQIVMGAILAVEGLAMFTYLYSAYYFLKKPQGP